MIEEYNDWLDMLAKVPNEPQLENLQAKGTRILAGRLASNYYDAQYALMTFAYRFGCIPVVLPTVESLRLYVDKMNKVGPEVENQMYVFKDKGDRDLCLRPEGTATCQALAQSTYKTYPNLKLCYWQKCFRYEKPQSGRYREFTQFGVEVLNPTRDWTDDLITLANEMLHWIGVDRAEYTISRGVKRGLGLYTSDGFEFTCEALGAQKQILGGGPYENGQGFAIGIDRVLLLPSVSKTLGGGRDLASILENSRKIVED